MSKIKLCSECFEEHEMRKIEDDIIHEIKGEKFKNKVKKYICPNCGQKSTPDSEFDKSLLKAFNEYRKKHNLLFPDEIKEIREIYGLNQRAFSRVLGWGEITIHRYENGALQDNPHDDLLQTLRENPENMKMILEKHKDNLKSKTYEKVKKKVNQLIQKENMKKGLINEYRAYEEEFTGNKPFELQKLSNVVVFFAEKINNLWKTKLLKLLWYAEFENYRKNSVSICGTPFIHYDHGPVPPKFRALFSVLEENEKSVEIKEIQNPIYSGEIFQPKSKFNESLFSSKELETLNFVTEKFKNHTSKELVNKTHEEEAYLKTNYEEPIPYEFSKNLKI
ncbi:MAG: putative Xre family transcriptional regulator [Candidatus Frackibacter sp. T328-2]|nr:MAG: putative Xre family transcriptional regulator [Candidatus Frackibacter sp. T328-2]